MQNFLPSSICCNIFSLF